MRGENAIADENTKFQTGPPVEFKLQPCQFGRSLTQRREDAKGMQESVIISAPGSNRPFSDFRDCRPGFLASFTSLLLSCR